MPALNAQPFLDTLRDAIHRNTDPDRLFRATSAAQAHLTAMKKIAAKSGGGYVDSAGSYDHTLYELANLLVKAREMVRRAKIFKKTGRVPKLSSRTAWKLR